VGQINPGLLNWLADSAQQPTSVDSKASECE
jgi:hypothetical protein